MKISKLLAGLILVIGFSWTIDAQTDSSDLTMPVDGTLMYVANNSGLYLRNAPSPRAKKIALMDYGDSVQVLDSAQSDQIEWMDGHWIKVRYGKTEGYTFSGFMSRWAMPYFGYDHVHCEDMPLLLDQYFGNGGVESYTSSIQTQVGYTSSYMNIGGVTVSEAFHILLQAMDYCPEKDIILEDLIFLENSEGRVVEIRGRTHDDLTIEENTDGSGVFLKWKTPCTLSYSLLSSP